ncbi:MAG: putative HTH-type transcriptional regulator [Actinomycetia bacterium]|nr:putative HTH-type transcriptional regulator [Actinomycetes bacterium]
MLLDRHRESEVLDELLQAVRGGESRVLVVRGEPGVGKSALLEYVVEQASGCRVARAAGVQSEMELAFAALHQLCAPMLDHLEQLPRPQRDALGTAFGMRAGDAPDRFLVGLAVLSLFSAVAEEQPLVCVVDDAQWLDRASAQTLAFVARRLLAESVALVFAVREPGEEELAGLSQLVVEGLSDDDARVLLDSAIHGPLDQQVRDRIIPETRGNPLALLELPRGLTPAELAGGFGLPDTTPLASRIEQSFRQRLQSLPGDTQQLLLAAAAEPLGDVKLLWRAVERLGIGVAAAAAAEAAGLIELGARVRFRHPLVRSAIYGAASPQARREIHGALAEATDPKGDPDRRAWHRAHAAAGPDETLARELESSAVRVQARAGFAAAAAFLERATELTPDPARRGARALAAAQAKLDAGAPDRAYDLVATAEMAPLDELQRVRVDVLRAHIAFARSRASNASALMLAAAQRAEPLDAALAREIYLEAFGAAMFAGRLRGAVGVREVANSARAVGRAASSLQAPRALDLLLDGLVTRFSEGYSPAVAPLRRAVQAFEALLRDYGRAPREVRFAWGVCPELWSDDAWHALANLGVRIARDAGALTALPVGLVYRAGLHTLAGEFAAAAADIEEANAIAAATGISHFDYASILLAALRGDEAQALEVIEASVQRATATGEGRAIGHAEHAAAVLYNCLGRYEAAVLAAQRACEHEDLGVFGWALAELVEAGARSGSHAVAADALEQLVKRTRASATDWALGIEARSRALLGDGEAAESLHREAIERLRRTRITVHLARAHLLYGEWLRRERRRADAREQLLTAHEMFITMGAEGFAARAERELVATGDAARKRALETSSPLTTQEEHVARLARDGLSNPEIGARLFLSPRTVQYHLRKVFMKLGITSRMQLDRVLPTDSGLTQDG